MNSKLNSSSERDKLLKEKGEIEKQLKQYEKAPDFGDDVDNFEEETDEAEEFSKNLGVQQALKERLNEIEESLRKPPA